MYVLDFYERFGGLFILHIFQDSDEIRLFSPHIGAPYLQEILYGLSKVGEAIDSNDLPTASDVLGPDTDHDWIKNVSLAFSKLSSRSESRNEADACTAALASLVYSVANRDINYSSKIAFVSSADALGKWAALTGLAGQLKGL